jgi:hypothetical protein
MLIHHAWLSVWLQSSYVEVEETDFDSYVSHFKTIVDYTSFIFSPEGEANSMNRKHFSLELGLIPPLWWTVMKCRHLKIRHRAHWLLGQAGREGLWDPIMLHEVASETMLLEERWSGVEFDPAVSSSSMDLDTTSDDQADLDALIPLRYRISAAKVSNVDEDQKMIQITFTRKEWYVNGAWTGDFEQIVRERRLESLPKLQVVESIDGRTTSNFALAI